MSPRAVPLAALVAFAAACSGPPAPQLRPPPVGVVSGEVFLEAGGASVDGAVVELAGTSTRAVTRSGRQFVLTAVPVGANVVLITHVESGRVRRLDVTVEQANQTVVLTPEQTSLVAAATLDGLVTVPDGSPAGAVAYLVGGSGRQTAPVGDDGRFTLEGLPPGPAKVGVVKVGFASVLKPITLAEGANDGGEFALSPAVDGTLALAGSVRLADRTEHAGIAILLNGGEKVATTDAAGAYAFTGLAAGVYALRATLSGYRSVDLPAIALDASGAAEGLVPALLTPGSDSDAAPGADRAFEVRVAAPASGAAFESGDEIAFHAEVSLAGENVPPSRVRWTITGVEPPVAEKPLGTGTIVTTRELPVGLHLARVTATASDGAQQSGEALVDVRAIALGLEITSHRDNAQVIAAVPTVFAARLDARPGLVVPDSAVEWSVRPWGTTEPATVLGHGLRLAAALPAVQERTLLEVSCDVVLPGDVGGDHASVAVFAIPFRPVPTVQPVFEGFGLSVPQPTTVLDDDGHVLRTEYAIAERQPVILRARLDDGGGEAFGGTVRWQSDTGILFTGLDADLSVLPVGTHDFTLTIASEDGASASSTVRVVVSAFVFTATVVAPVLSPAQPYFVDFGLPLEGSVAHPYQTAFPPTSVRWRAADGRQVSSGFRSTVRNLPAGPGALTFEVTDALGQLATASASYVLQAIEFRATFLSPADGTDVLEGTPLQLRATATHSLVPSTIPAASLRVRFLSHVQGLLADASGRTDFALEEVLVPSRLVAGTHVLTARVTDGTLVAEARSTVRIRSPGVTATLQAPTADLTLFPGTPVRFAAVVSSDSAVTPHVSWLLDGAEFPASWGGYGADPAAPARRTIDLGAYAATTAPFADPRWAAGPHRVQLFARAPDVDPALGCVNIPNRAVCATFAVYVAPASPDIVATTIGAGQTVVWDGLRRLKGIVLVDGGTLVVNPGARIVIDATGNYNERYIRVRSGTVRVGSLASAEPVVFESSVVGAGKWRGFSLEPASAASETTVVLENTVIRHSSHALAASSSFWTGDHHRVELRRVTVEQAFGAWLGFCPQVADEVTIRDATEAAIVENNNLNCPSPRVYRRLRFERCPVAIDIYEYVAADVVVEQSVFIGTPLFAGDLRTGSLVLRDNLVHASSRSNWSAFSFNAASYGGPRVILERNVFRENVGASAVWLEGYRNDGLVEGVDRDVRGNLFEHNAAALRDRAIDRRGVRLHGNTFVDNGLDLDVEREGAAGEATDAPDVEAFGNYLGAAGEAGSAGGVLQALPAGQVANLPRILDTFDAAAKARVLRADNPLQAAATAPQVPEILAGRAWPVPPLVVDTPLAIIRQPAQTLVYRADRCVPLEALAPFDEVDPATDCRWLAAPNDVPNPVLVAVSRTAAGCLDATQFGLRDGEFRLRLECTDPASGRIDVHDTRFRLSAGARSGVQADLVDEWSGEVLLDGDFTVPAGHTLRIAAGTRVRFAANDRLRGARTPWMLGMPGNLEFGSRALVDLFVEGTLEVLGTAQAPVRFEAITGAELAGQWGGIRVDRGATATLDHARISGATIGVHGLTTWADVGDMPTLVVRDSTFAGVRSALRSACPATFDGVTVDRAEHVLADGRCHQSVAFTNGTFTRLANRGAVPAIYVRPTSNIGPISLAFTGENLTFSRETGDRDGTAISVDDRDDESAGFGFTRLQDVTIQHFGAVFDWDQSLARLESFDVTRLRVSNFGQLFASLNYRNEDEIVIRDSVVENGLMGIHSAPGRFTLSNSTVRDVRTFVGYWTGSSFGYVDIGGGRLTTLDLRGNRFERVHRVAQLRHVGPASSTVVAGVLSGNNFLGILDRVVHVESYNLANGNGLALDLRGSWWGTATEAAIRGLITDPQADVGAGYKGRTRYEGFAAAPLTLTTPE